MSEFIEYLKEVLGVIGLPFGRFPSGQVRVSVLDGFPGRQIGWCVCVITSVRRGYTRLMKHTTTAPPRLAVLRDIVLVLVSGEFAATRGPSESVGLSCGPYSARVVYILVLVGH